jgi:thioester reductase-like protein
MPHPGYDRVTLLTGFPSFFPRKLARQILEQEPRALLYALVRPKFAVDARAVVATWPSDLSARFVILEGDAASMDLGLSGAEFRMLAREVDIIHHAAHVTYLGVEKRAAEQVNVVGAREIIELGRACQHLQCLAFHSTVDVAGNRSGVVLESELEAGQTFASPVVETRAWAEKVAHSAMAELPIVVIRAGTVVGDSVTGEIDRFDGPYLLMLLIVSSAREVVLPFPGRADTPLNLVPIDYVVRAAYAIAGDRRAMASAERTFHLVDPQPKTAREVFEAVARASGRPIPRGFLPPQFGKLLLRAPGMERFARSPRAFMERLSNPARFDAANTEALLAGSGIVCPPFDDYVDPLVGYIQAKLRERRERRAVGKQAKSDEGPNVSRSA